MEGNKEMKSFTKLVLATAMLGTLVGCSSSAPKATDSTTVDHKYSETADVSTLTFEDTTFHGMTIAMPTSWSGRKSASTDEIDYAVKGSKDAVQLIYTDQATASEEMLSTIQTSMTWKPSKTEETEVNGIKAFHATGISTVFNVIQMDANTELYLFQDGAGVTAVLLVQDPEGTVDQSPVFEKILSSIKMN